MKLGGLHFRTKKDSGDEREASVKRGTREGGVNEPKDIDCVKLWRGGGKRVSVQGSV